MAREINIRILLACAAALVVTAQPATHADKLSTDPNAAPKTQATAPAVTDTRLDQKIVYQKGYARLHTICEELTRQTGVTIYAGSSQKDWQVRDIPMIVCVKDVPLGKLLSIVCQRC